MAAKTSDKLDKIKEAVDRFTVRLRRGHLIGSYEVAKETACILKDVIQICPWKTEEDLINILKEYGDHLSQHKPLELVIVNTLRRILYAIREESKNLQKRNELKKKFIGNAEESDFLRSVSMSMLMQNTTSGTSSQLLPYFTKNEVPHRSASRIIDTSSQPGLLKVLSTKDDQSQTLSDENIGDLKDLIVECVDEFIEELDSAYSNIGDQAQDHIHANEVIMTFGKSKAVAAFLKAAARHRKFEVIVAEAAPSYAGHEMAKSLSSCNAENKDSTGSIEVTLIPDTAIFALMSRVHKVIVGTHAVMASGGLVARSGSHMLIEAAKYHSVSVVVCTGIYKLSPLYVHDLDTFNELHSPSEVLSFKKAQSLDVSVKNPSWDYIPPELISLYITNIGSYSPSYIYRILAEYYCPEDAKI
ncbi:translation initiation factor eIF-2B subunit beta-like [Schistocerca gregaria]|uniref:translation initiation factor eIF-2B subunit beta-like n=1 Tax=Schistocerca gregaria TaxID=7010 RepID=UPI00211EFA7F|nr:translation initiation factor eIF-2B subunit beta-like [Schistocerca gregaria]